MEKDYRIDFDMFEIQEILKIIDFFRLIEQSQKKKANKEVLIDKYKEYQKIINNKTLEKKYDKMLYEKSGVSIYQTMKQYLNRGKSNETR